MSSSAAASAAPSASSVQAKHGGVLEAFYKGAMSGSAAAILLQPLDVLKTRQQGVVTTGSPDLVGPVTTGRVSTREAFRGIIADHGVAGLWRGLKPTLMRAAIGPGVFFSILDVVQGRRGDDYAAPKLTVFLEGALARSVAGTLLCPLGVVKTRYEYTRDVHVPGVGNMLARIAREEGVPGLFRGLVPTLVRDIPSTGLYLMFYKSVFQPRFRSLAAAADVEVSQTIVNLAAAGLAAVVATVISQPFDVLRTTLQLNNDLSLYEGAMSVWRTRGLAGFGQGLGPRLLRRPLNMAITWTLYEKFLTPATSSAQIK